jgi:hypothetical protein
VYAARREARRDLLRDRGQWVSSRVGRPARRRRPERIEITRTVLTGIVLMAKGKGSIRFVEDLDAASSWFAERVGKARVAGLAEAVGDWRKDILDKPPRSAADRGAHCVTRRWSPKGQVVA